jgi:hypothetical protein
MKYKDELKEEAKIMGVVSSWIFWLCFVVIIVGIGGLIVRPYILDLQNKQNQHTYEYVTSVKEAMVSDWLEWKQLDAEIKEQKNPDVIAAKKANQAALVREMRIKSQRINPDEVPQDLAQFLSTH